MEVILRCGFYLCAAVLMLCAGLRRVEIFFSIPGTYSSARKARSRKRPAIISHPAAQDWSVRARTLARTSFGLLQILVQNFQFAGFSKIVILR